MAGDRLREQKNTHKHTRAYICVCVWERAHLQLGSALNAAATRRCLLTMFGEGSLG